MHSKEQSAIAKSCTHENNFNYDTCIYGLSHNKLKKELNCDFSFIVGGNNLSHSKISKECKLFDLSAKEQTHFKEILTGKI